VSHGTSHDSCVCGIVREFPAVYGTSHDTCVCGIVREFPMVWGWT